LSHTPTPSKRTTKGESSLEAPNLYFYQVKKGCQITAFHVGGLIKI